MRKGHIDIYTACIVVLVLLCRRQESVVRYKIAPGLSLIVKDYFSLNETHTKRFFIIEMIIQDLFDHNI